MCRWEPRISLDVHWGFAGVEARDAPGVHGVAPSRFPWEDIAGWLWEACDSLDEELLLRELESRPRPTWMKAACSETTVRNATAKEWVGSVARSGENVLRLSLFGHWVRSPQQTETGSASTSRLRLLVIPND